MSAIKRRRLWPWLVLLAIAGFFVAASEPLLLWFRPLSLLERQFVGEWRCRLTDEVVTRSPEIELELTFATDRSYKVEVGPPWPTYIMKFSTITGTWAASESGLFRCPDTGRPLRWDTAMAHLRDSLGRSDRIKHHTFTLVSSDELCIQDASGLTTTWDRRGGRGADPKALRRRHHGPRHVEAKR